jgi:hypothetical protein
MSEERIQELRWLCFQYGEMKADPARVKVCGAIDDCIRLVTQESAGLESYLRMYVIERGCTFSVLMHKGMPCAHGMFYKIRNAFFSALDAELKTRYK